MRQYYVDLSDFDRPIKVMAFPILKSKFISIITKKFPSCANAAIKYLRANNQIQVDSKFGTVPFMLLSDYNTSKQYYVDPSGQISNVIDLTGDVGIRPEIYLVYDKNSCVTQTLRSQTVASIVLDPDTQKPVLRKEEYDVVTFGKNDYIWLNYNSCKHGQQYMDLYSIDCLDSMKKPDSNSSFMSSTKIQNQYVIAATKHCSQEEKDLVVEVTLDPRDDQLFPIPNFTSEQWEIIYNNSRKFHQ